MCVRDPEWTTLDALPTGAVFVTRDGVKAVKSEYHYGHSPKSQWVCILLESGEYAHFFPEGNHTEVQQIVLD